MSPSPAEEAEGSQDAATAQPLSALEALHSTPSRRYLAPDPIPDDVLWAILDAAIRGPSGGNRQQWGWVVLTDQAVKEQVAGWYRANWDAAYGQYRDRILAGEGTSDISPREFLGAEHLAHHLEEAPVWGSRCCGTRPTRRTPGSAPPSTARSSSSAWPPARTASAPR